MSNENIEITKINETENVQKDDDMQMSDKVYAIRQLPDSDNKDTVVQEIRALRNFSPDERSSLFGNSEILWIIENYTIRELKDRAEKGLVSVDVQVGDVVRYEGTSCVVLGVSGRLQDRVVLIFLQDGDFKIIEGVSKYNIKITSHIDVDALLTTLMK